MKDLSVIIVSYNTKKLTQQCIESLIKQLSKTPQLTTEIIVIDNASVDDSTAMLKQLQNRLRTTNYQLLTTLNHKNLGYGRANNIGIAASTGKYVLLLNSDVVVQDVDFAHLIKYLDKNPKKGVLTVRVTLPSGKIDMASHRGFPTLWNTATYFTKLESLFSNIPILNKIFGGYHLTHLDLNTIHEIDSPHGAFYLTKKAILDSVGGFDPAFFMYGEDLDLSYRIKKAGYGIIYYPQFTVLHLKYQSGLKQGEKQVQSKTKQHFFSAMKIFYDKHYAPQNSPLKNKLVYFFINLRSNLS